MEAVSSLANSGLDVYAHNIETMRSLHRIVRDPRAGLHASWFICVRRFSSSYFVWNLSTILSIHILVTVKPFIEKPKSNDNYTKTKFYEIRESLQ